MKKLVLFLGMVVCVSGNVAMAKKKKDQKSSDAPAALEMNSSTALPTGAAGDKAAPATTLKADDMAFTELSHDYGTVQEGPDAVTKFTFVNKGKEPIIIQKAQASCGCTVPTYSKDPIAPGAVGNIDVAFHTLGKAAGAFTKTVTVTSNAGVKILTIKGNVEKAPQSSAPENTSMVKMN